MPDCISEIYVSFEKKSEFQSLHKIRSSTAFNGILSIACNEGTKKCG